jgi:hypothetical protein
MLVAVLGIAKECIASGLNWCGVDLPLGPQIDPAKRLIKAKAVFMTFQNESNTTLNLPRFRGHLDKVGYSHWEVSDAQDPQAVYARVQG